MLIIGIIAWVVFAFLPAELARRKGYSFALFFILSILVSWIVTLVVVLFLKNKNLSDSDRKALDSADKAS